MQYKTTKEEKFDDIYRTYQNDVYKISLYYTKDEYIAQDISQKVFFQFYLHFENVNMGSVRAYLLRAARNLSYNWLRDTKRELQGEDLENISEENAALHSVEDGYIREEQKRSHQEFLTSVMESLREENESWYNILHLIYGLEKDGDEAAEELGITREALYSKLYRAKRWIRKKFEKEYQEL